MNFLQGKSPALWHLMDSLTLVKINIMSQQQQLFLSGVKRCCSEMEEGQLDLTSCCSPYCMFSVRYTDDNYRKLLNLSEYNILNNSQMIMQALQTAMQRRRQKMCWLPIQLPLSSQTSFSCSRTQKGYSFFKHWLFCTTETTPAGAVICWGFSIPKKQSL